MDVDTRPEKSDTLPKKPPRKPRPSEIAAKKAKRSAKRPKVAKSKRKPAKKAKGRPATGVVRSQRLDMRLSKPEKAKVLAKAKKLRRTVTSIVLEAIEKLK